MSEYVNVCVKHTKGKTIVTFHGDDCPLCEAERVMGGMEKALRADDQYWQEVTNALKSLTTYRERYQPRRDERGECRYE